MFRIVSSACKIVCRRTARVPYKKSSTLFDYQGIFRRKNFSFGISNVYFSSTCLLQSENAVPIFKLPTKKLLSFVCKKCDHRNTKFISKQAYDKGVVIVKCDGCKNNHLIADNLNWFQLGEVKNIEDILKAKGETIRKELSSDGSLEVMLNDNKE